MSNPPRESSHPQGLHSLRWPCPACRDWHSSEVSARVQIGELVRVRCPKTGAVIERPLAIHLDAPRETAPAKPALRNTKPFSRIRGWIRPGA
jgi:hypothetical protein